jgi:ABC-2 type transport system ATP-binding protein
MDQSVLKVEKLVKDYGAYRAVDNVSFEIKKGQVLGLLGPNGAGKTTTIQILIGITNSTAGKISYFGQNFKAHKQVSLQRINSTSAYNTLLGRISVKENLMTFAGLYGVSDKIGKIAELLEQFEVGHLADQRYINLSAGERTRVNLAKSLLNDPELVLMDEPTASLDPDIADKTLSWIEELRRNRSLSILFTSHNMDEVERICDEVVFLDKGKIVSRGSPSDHTSKLSDVEVFMSFSGQQEIVIDKLTELKLAYDFPSKNLLRIETKKNQAAEIISKIVDSGIKISDTEIRKPDLEQVFLQIARSQK